MADDMLSSPDPLNDSPTFHGPFSSQARRHSPTRRSLPPHNSSPTKQMFELDVGPQLSPQKIRVTVEAGDSEARDIFADYTNTTSSRKRRSLLTSHAPRSRQSIHTTTTTVPLKGLSGSEYETQSAATPKRGRGRPRKSNGTPVPSKKRGRPSTPTRRSSLLDLVDDDSSAGEFGIGSNVGLRRRKGASRPRPRKKAPQKSPAGVESQVDPETHVSSTASKKGRPRRKTLIPEDVQILEDYDHINDTNPASAHEVVEIGGPLYPIDPNSPTKSSTTRSFGDGQEDILIAKFHPGDETPRRAGWSSPRVQEIRETLSPELVPHNHSPNNHRVSPFNNSGDQSAASNPQAAQRPSLSPSQYEDEEDGVREMENFDTIMVSEEFSMISVDSVSSLWAPRISSGNEIQGNKSAEQTADLSRLPGQQMQAGAMGNTFGEILDDRPEATTPQRRVEDIRLLSARSARTEDSFSSIPPQVLKAATPAGKSHINNMLSNNNSRLEDSFSDIASEVLDAATPGRVPTDIRLSAAAMKHRNNFEDSISVVPSVVLDAATPAAKHQEHANPRGSRHTGSESGKLNVVGSNLSLGSSHAQNHASPRLLTPEETPSPLLEILSSTPSRSTGKVPLQTAEDVTKEITETERYISDSQVPSSPPALDSRRQTHSAHLRQLNPSIAETPFITFSSPSLPPLMQQPREERAVSEGLSDSQRPTLSPIARAGRALQDLVTPSQPRSRSQSLGSPFNSPANRKSPGAVQGPSQSPFQGLGEKPPSAIGMSDKLSPVSSQKTAWTLPARQDDPFDNNDAPRSHRSPSFEERSQYSLELPGERRLSDPIITNHRSITDRMQSDDVMSWQMDEDLPTDNNVVPMTNTANSPGDAKSSATAHFPSTKGYNLLARENMHIASTNIRQVTASFNRDTPEDDQDAGDDFDLLLETMNPSSPVPYQKEQPKDAAEKPRRPKIPSPWWKNSRRLAYSDELSHISSPAQETEHPLAGNILGGVVPKPVTDRPIEAGRKDDKNLDAVDLSKYQIPQKANFQPRARETEPLDLSSLLGGSPGKPLPVLSNSSRNISSRVERNLQGPPSIVDEEERSDPIRSTLKDWETFTPIPQKQGFKPRVRSEASEVFEASGPRPVEQSSFSLFNGKPEAPVPITSENMPSPPKPSSTGNIPLLHTIPSEAPSSPHYLYDDNSSVSSNMDNENQHFTSTRTLQWAKKVGLTSADAFTPLPVSPTKSCLRSPLKAQFGNSRSPSESPSKGVTFASSSPTPSPPTEPLSATTWSKAHWLLLDGIVQSWRPQNQYTPDRDSSGDGSESMKEPRRNSTRVISRLLGRKVHSNGYGMVLEQWHLEAVDEFRGQVPGWEEKVIALRVFSLLVGEQRRLRNASS